MEACELCFVFSDEDPENVESEVGESCLSGVYVYMLLYWDVRVQFPDACSEFSF